MAPLLRERAGDSVYRTIRNAIETGELGSGQALTSTRALQETLGASFHAVRAGMEQLEREGFIERRQGSGCYVRRPPKPRKGWLGTIALLRTEPFSRIPFLAPVLQAIKAESQRAGFKLLDDLPDLPRRGVPQQSIDADVVIWAFAAAPDVIALPPGPPFVLISNAFSAVPAEGTSFDVVTVDDRQGSALAGRYLRGLGCSRPVFVGVGSPSGAAWQSFSETRLRGFETGWGRPVPEEDCIRLDHYSTALAVKAGGRLFASGPLPDCIFAASDDIALGMNHAALAHGIRLGKDVKLIGFDGQPPVFPGDPALTTIAGPLEEIGRAAVRLAAERASAPSAARRKVCFQCSLRKGDTA